MNDPLNNVAIYSRQGPPHWVIIYSIVIIWHTISNSNLSLHFFHKIQISKFLINPPVTIYNQIIGNIFLRELYILDKVNGEMWPLLHARPPWERRQVSFYLLVSFDFIGFLIACLASICFRFVTLSLFMRDEEFKNLLVLFTQEIYLPLFLPEREIIVLIM